VPELELSAGVYNLFDEDYSHPGAAEHTQDLLEQDGRTFRLKLQYAF
jgi:iron complex outermembrane receptor protein